MSSYNNIVKIKYSEKQAEADVVQLEEYIIFEDERAKQKYIVFKFINKINQQLQGLEFEVHQYNLNNELVEKSVVIYDKFLARAEEPFVPNAKLKVNYGCKSISIKIIKAAYDRCIFDNGTFLDNSYKFDHYFGDAFGLKKDKKEGEEQGGDGKKGAAPKKARKPKGDVNVGGSAPKKGVIVSDLPNMGNKSFLIEDESSRNRAKLPTIVNALLIIGTLAFVGYSLYLTYNEKNAPKEEGAAIVSIATCEEVFTR